MIEVMKTMKKRLQWAVMLVLLLAGACAAADQERVDQTIDANAEGFVHINVVRGDLVIKGWDKAKIRVTGQLDEQTEAFIFDVNGDDARIEVRIPSHRSGWWGNQGSDLTVYLPRDSDVAVSVVSTDVDADDIRGGIEVGGVSGDLHVERASKRIDLRTVSGDIDLREATGRISVKTVSGDVESRDTTGRSIYGSVSGTLSIDKGGEDLELESVSGDLVVADTAFVSIRGHTVSGDVDIGGVMQPEGIVEFDSVSGDIRLGVGGEVGARFDLETGSGSIHNRLTSDSPRTSKYARNETLRFMTGDGKAEVVLSTRSGDIILGR